VERADRSGLSGSIPNQPASDQLDCPEKHHGDEYICNFCGHQSHHRFPPEILPIVVVAIGFGVLQNGRENVFPLKFDGWHEVCDIRAHDSREVSQI
jgi:hypothetical protein